MKKIHEKKMRMTDQRRVILEELCSVTSHPTADELCAMVRKRLPRVSLGTVYRNLEVLSSIGQIRKLEITNGPMRFDGDISAHHHIRCEVCGKVGDIFNGPSTARLERALDTDFKITGHTLEFVGICPKCQRNKETTQ